LTNYRGKIDITADILRAAETDVKKTQLMYQANLSFAALQRYLLELTQACLIAHEDERHCYMLTEKGREFLAVYKEYSKVNKHMEKRINNIRLRKKELTEMLAVKSWK
jgi:predicted transcriptional regulator